MKTRTTTLALAAAVVGLAAVVVASSTDRLAWTGTHIETRRQCGVTVYRVADLVDLQYRSDCGGGPLPVPTVSFWWAVNGYVACQADVRDENTWDVTSATGNTDCGNYLQHIPRLLRELVHQFALDVRTNVIQAAAG